MIQSQKDQIDIQKELKALYKKWPDVKYYLKSIGCKTTDAEDIFQEALLIYTRKVNNPEFELTVQPFHYVKNTCKYLWYNQSRKEGKIQLTEFSENFAEDDDQWFQKEMKLRSIEKALTKIGKQCQDLLKLFYGLGWSMIDVAKKLGLRNDKVAKAQKYRCLIKVKEQLSSEQTNSQTI
jgi:RNA polymerase sigma factor (sigma-70 family)